jgi:hypothetical protein
MHRSRPRKLLALFAVLALLLATTAYLSHIHANGGKLQESTHCDLCLQFSGTGGPSALPKLPVRSALIVMRLPPACHADGAISRDQPLSHRTRAPPFVT